MASSTESLVPMTRAFLTSYYDTYKFLPLSDDIPRLSSEIRSLTADLLSNSSATPGEERLVVDELESPPPHKVDESMWKNREHMEEVVLLLDRPHWPQSVSIDVNVKQLVLPYIFLFLIFGGMSSFKSLRVPRMLSLLLFSFACNISLI
ncbi:hypothetical protein RchiOBHm_Chr3g0494831 [Rosa chinensis]|uniref:Uncharacterized protein n=1 Tax=Rosa chinensis TaxID=74649 RepID=A0A2P6RH31_ROSCH|nr:hypothetical protein RchiOBHm_Chr3g0494831 [Rosa chinensis]